MSNTNEFIVTDENRDLYDRVIHIAQADDPVRLFVYGPHASGKTTLVRERGRERDLLSAKTVMFCHALELVSMFNLGEIGESFLDRAGSADVLLIDGFESFFKGDALARSLGALLIDERHRGNLSTLVFSNEPYDGLPSEMADGRLADYECYTLAPAC